MSDNLKKKVYVSEFERVPPCYKEVEKVLNAVKSFKGSLKTVVYNSGLRGPILKKVYSLSENVLKHRQLLEKVIEETSLLEKEPFLRKEFAGILIYEILYGKGLPGESRPVLAIKKHEKEIREAYDIAKKDKKLSLTDFPSLPRYVRVNTIASSVSAVLEDLRNSGVQKIPYDETTSLDEYIKLVKSLQVGSFLIDFHFKDLLVFAGKEKLPIHLQKKGHVFIQDKSSYIPVHVLNPKPGCTVFDACAAPGMKTIHIAAAMKNEGKIYAYERDKQRFETLKTTLNSANVKICQAYCKDFYEVNANDPKFRCLEYILVDPSCSGSGMVSRMDKVTDTEDSKSKHRLEKLAGFQILLLKHALSFPSVKRVVYSTCSITEEENEFVVHEVLNNYSNIFKLVSVMPEWPIRGSDNFEYGHLCLRAYPDESLTNGFFVAMFERLEIEEYMEQSLSNQDGMNQASSNFIETAVEKGMEDKAMRKKNKKQRIHSENQETIPEENFIATAVEQGIEDKAMRKKNKRQRIHSEIPETISEENFTESSVENNLEENTARKKHKKKKLHSENRKTIPEENFTESKVEKGIEDKATRNKNKRQKIHSEIQETIPEENFIKSEVENNLEENTARK